MNRFFSFITAFVAFIFSGYVSLQFVLKRYDSTLEFDWLTDSKKVVLVVGFLLLSVFTLFSFGTKRLNKENEFLYVHVKTEHGEAKIAQSVFEELIGSFLHQQKQIAAFSLSIGVLEKGIDVHVSITPDIEQEGSFVDLTKIVTETVKETILKMTSVTVENVHYSFESPQTTLKKKTL